MFIRSAHAAPGEHFFMTYKELEGGETANRGWGDREAAEKIVVEALGSYAEKALQERAAASQI